MEELVETWLRMEYINGVTERQRSLAGEFDKSCFGLQVLEFSPNYQADQKSVGSFVKSLSRLLKYIKRRDSSSSRGFNFPMTFSNFEKEVASELKSNNEKISSYIGFFYTFGIFLTADEEKVVVDIDYFQIKKLTDLIKGRKRALKDCVLEVDCDDVQTEQSTSMLKRIAEDLLDKDSYLDREKFLEEEELNYVLNDSSYRESFEHVMAKSRLKHSFNPFCLHGTKKECQLYQGDKNSKRCTRLHFKKVVQKHTDELLGDCSFLNSCFHMHLCKYIHYEVDTENYLQPEPNLKLEESIRSNYDVFANRCLNNYFYPAQWITCDVRYFDLSILGKFDVIMADPPWDIHMDLPYGTLADDEMRGLPIPTLQDDGYIFLWVTGRAMELGRECLSLWGYKRCDELIWVKLNQIQRLIRTGRTGHWLNHGKEHCLVGVKGKPKHESMFFDSDVVLSEVRDTSHKPDEIYGIIERLSPGTRKIEIFGRQHNIQPNWITLGNQLSGTKLVDPDLIERYNQKYPDGQPSK